MENVLEHVMDMDGVNLIHAGIVNCNFIWVRKWSNLFLCLFRCDSGFSGDFCEISNITLFNRGSFLFDNNDNQTDLITYQGIF